MQIKNRSIKNICLLLVLSLILTACGSASSEAKIDGPSGGSYQLPSPITAISEGESSANPSPDGGEEKVEAKAWDSMTMKETFHGDGFDVIFALDSTWQGGFNARIFIDNTGDQNISDWTLSFDYPDDLSNVWNAVVKKSGKTGYKFKCYDWNSKIDVGQSAEIGMSVQTDFQGFPSTYQLTCERSKPDPSQVVPTKAPKATATPQAQASAAPSASASAKASVTPAKKDTNEKPGGKAPTKGTEVHKHGRLKVKGRFIVDAYGRKYLLKGPSTHGIAWFPQYVNKSAFKSFKKWGANTVRLACYSSEGEMYNTDSVWKSIDKGVKAASSLGMYVIIDWHILNENKPMMSYDRAKAFFKHFAKKYGKKKNVIWEICNEPHWCEWKTDIKPYAKKIIKLIRKYSKNIIVVGTPTWSQDVDVVAQSRLTGKFKKNVCYTLHFYAATHKDDLRNRVNTAISKKLPILCTEFSICDASGNGGLDKASGSAWIKLLKKNKIGFISWSLCNKDESASLLKPSCQKTGGFKKSDLSETGKWVIKKWK